MTKRALTQVSKTQRRSICEATLILMVVVLVLRTSMALHWHLDQKLLKTLYSENPANLEVLRIYYSLRTSREDLVKVKQ
jgi:hypothetical protein